MWCTVNVMRVPFGMPTIFAGVWKVVGVLLEGLGSSEDDPHFSLKIIPQTNKKVAIFVLNGGNYYFLTTKGDRILNNDRRVCLSVRRETKIYYE